MSNIVSHNVQQKLNEQERSPPKPRSWKAWLDTVLEWNRIKLKLGFGIERS